MRRVRLALILCSCLALAPAAWAAAKAPAKPIKGAQYEGVTAREGPAVLERASGRKKSTILLRVAKSGKSVKVLVPVLPTGCAQTGQGPIETSTPARISSKGAFSGTIVYKGVFSPKITAKAVFSGRFNGRHASGTLRAEFVTAQNCNVSTTFTATAPAPKKK